ncbi:hypothetical protein SAMN05216323_101523 [Williamwhitmania taraxaci]|uniref:Uncharacterized protein n=1 Tax=Williamwhitmania taraxaci TaxID=1640674 RepID=A0A1G6IBL8_9BACT|nr:hypothetical protein SAMN05216323_101523 [Williamwhitmania taraxaci]
MLKKEKLMHDVKNAITGILTHLFFLTLKKQEANSEQLA